jgi:hypothetical protein
MDIKKRRYQDETIALLTKHRKEKVMEPAFNKVLGANLVTVNTYDTDQLGTFTSKTKSSHSHGNHWG